MIKYKKEFILTRTDPSTNIDTITRAQDTLEQDIYKEQIKMYVSHREKYLENKDKLYSVIWGQSSDTIQSKLQSKSTFQHIDDNSTLSYLCIKCHKNTST